MWLRRNCRWLLMWLQDDLTTLLYSVLTGGVVATSVFFFDVSIQYIHDLPDILSR